MVLRPTSNTSPEHCSPHNPSFHPGRFPEAPGRGRKSDMQPLPAQATGRASLGGQTGRWPFQREGHKWARLTGSTNAQDQP